MSVINEALKKAQEVKESRDIEFAGRFTSRKRSVNIPFGGLIFYSLIIITAVLLLFVTYSMLEQDNNEMTVYPEPEAKGTDNNEIMTPQILYDMAKQFHKNGNISEAKKYYMKSLKMDPGYIDALNNLGVISIHEKEYSSAQKYFEKAVILNPEYAIPYYNLACLLSIDGRIDKGMMYLHKAVSLDSTVREWAASDTDFKTLRGNPEFERIIKGELR